MNGSLGFFVLGRTREIQHTQALRTFFDQKASDYREN
jgi:hypothetical protein